MRRASSSLTLGIRRAAFVAAGVFWAFATLGADDGSGRNARVRLTFGVDVPRLENAGAVRRWVATDLHRRLGLADTDVLVVDRVRPLGKYRIVSLSQTSHGVPVLHRESRLLLNGDHEPVHLLGYHSPFPNAPAPHARVSGLEAVSIAGGRARDSLSLRLVYWPAGDHVRLSYELEGTFPSAARPAASVERVYVDAATGQVLDRRARTRRALYRRIHDFAQACRRLGVGGPVDYADSVVLRGLAPVVRSETVNTGRRSAERLFDILGSIYSFLEVFLGMDSFDGAGAPLVAFFDVRYQAQAEWPQCIGDEFNASWVGGGHDHILAPVAALDYPEVLAHEVVHGVVSSGSGLIYRNQSGALDEAISDALGVTIAAWLRAGAPASADVRLRMTSRDWQLHDPLGAFRDMRNPGSVGPYPDHYDDYRYLDEHDDNGGVHTNSSIINQGFYLLAEGGRHPRRPGEGPIVDGIGVLRAAQIFGTAAAERILLSNSNFEDARYGFADVAEALHGEGSREWVAVHTAMDAIGVPGDWEGDASKSSAVLVLSLIAGVALLGAAGLMIGLRPGRSSADRRIGTDHRVDQPPNGGVMPVPRAKSARTERKEALLGTLQSVDGAGSIPLPETLLTSREGMVIGRNIDLCHVEIQLPTVSRRHVRLRAMRGTVLVEDLNSLEGTRVDGVDLKPFEPRRMTSGQTLGIGGSAFRVQLKVELRFRP